jgi:hypothetical protein
MKANQINPTKAPSILMKGPPGFGKTIAACTAAIYGEVWLAYFDKNEPIELLTFFKKHRPELLDRIDYDLYGSANCNEYLNKLVSFSKKGCRYAAIITDSVTTLTSAAVNWSIGFRDPRGPKKDDVAHDSIRVVPDFDEYKVETSIATQALDICTQLNVMNIWTAHPLTSLKMEGSGKIDRITKTSSIVSYGSKVGSLVPARFHEIYHFGRQSGKRAVFTDLQGDDFAKTSLGLPSVLEIEDKLFFEVWRDALTKQGLIEKEVQNG